MNAHEPLADAELEAMLARLTGRGRADGLEAAIMAAVDTAPQRRGPWFRWPGWRLTPAPELRLLWYLAIVGLLLALVAATLVVGSRLLERTSPFPAPLPALLEGMVTEEVEPGVWRVVSDGVRDLSHLGDGTVDITPDGSVWLLSNPEGTQEDLFRLGQEPVFEFPARWPSWPAYLEVAPDGSLWAIGRVGVPDDRTHGVRTGIFSFDGDGWTMRATVNQNTTALAVGPDGTVWMAAATHLMRLGDDGSLTAVEDWADVYDGYVSPNAVAVSPDGDVWLMGTGRDGSGDEALLRFDGERWEAIPGPPGWESRPESRQLGFGLDGALWVNTSTQGNDGRDVGGLARFDDRGWTVFTTADGVEPWGGEVWGCIGTSKDLLTVAPDGSFWLNGRGGCGVAHWDGTTWTSYLVDSNIDDLAVAPDGSVWLRAGVPGWDVPGTLDTYVIRPEVAATTE